MFPQIKLAAGCFPSSYYRIRAQCYSQQLKETQTHYSKPFLINLLVLQRMDR